MRLLIESANSSTFKDVPMKNRQGYYVYPGFEGLNPLFGKAPKIYETSEFLLIVSGSEENPDGGFNTGFVSQFRTMYNVLREDDLSELSNRY